MHARIFPYQQRKPSLLHALAQGAWHPAAHVAGVIGVPERYLLIFLPIGVAAILCFYCLGATGFWLDEAVSVTSAQLDWSKMWRVIRFKEPNMILYHVLLHFWLKFGTGEFAARSLSAVFAVLSIFPVYGMGARLFGSRTGLIASLLLAVNSFFIRYAQEARSYTLYFFLGACASYLFLRAIDHPSVKNWGLYAVAGALSIYAHFFAVWLLLAHCISAFVFPRSGTVRRGMFLAHALIGVLASPLLVPIMAPGSYSSHIGWLLRPSLWTLGAFFGTLSGGFGDVLPGVGYATVCGYALFYAWMRPLKDPRQPWSFVFLLNVLFVPVVASFLFSIAFKPIFFSRYLITSIAPLVLIAAFGLEKVRPLWLKSAGVLLLMVFSVHSLAPLYTNGQPFTRESWRPVVAYVVGQSTAKDGIVFDQRFARIPFEYYFHEMYPRAKNPTPIWPSDPWGELDETAPRAWQWPFIKAMEYPRLWRIFLHQIPTNLEYRWRPPNSETTYCLIQSKSFPFLLVTIYQSCP